MTNLPVAHGSNGFATTHAGARRNDDLRQHSDAPRPRAAGRREQVTTPAARNPYDWQDDAVKCYSLACDLIGERIVRRRIIAAIKARAKLPIIEIAEAIE